MPQREEVAFSDG